MRNLLIGYRVIELLVYSEIVWHELNILLNYVKNIKMELNIESNEHMLNYNRPIDQTPNSL